MIDRTTGLKTSARKPANGQAWLEELKRDIEAGVRFFWNNRPGIHAGHLNGFGSWAPTAGKSYSSREIAEAYLAIERPARGTLQNMAAGVGLNYSAVWAQVAKVRKERKALAAGEVSQ